jgi:glycosyltransferase involved in cell wall biosynthesis
MMEKPLRLLILADGVFPLVVGGMQRHSSYLVRFLVARGHHVTLGHFVPPGQAIPDRDAVCRALEIPPDAPFDQVCVRFPSFGRMPGHYLRESYACSRILYDRLRSRLGEYDFIYAKGFMGWYFVEMRQKKSSEVPPVGVKFHGYEMFQRNAGWKEWLRQQLLRSPVRWITTRADAVFSYGGRITEIIRTLGVPPERICEVASGIEPSWLADKPGPHEGPVRFLFTGRFERRKGIQELHSALGMLDGQPGWEMDFIGPIPARERISLPNVRYHGQVTDKNDMLRVMDACDVLVAPSYSEGMPNVILEAMARGLAVLASDVGAVNIAVDDDNGWLISEVTPGAIAAAMSAVTSISREELDVKRRNSVGKVRRDFSWEKIADRTEREIRRQLPVNH